MEVVAIGVLMLLSFALGAYVRKPFVLSGKKEVNQPVEVQLTEDDIVALEEEAKIQAQIQALYAYTEKNALTVDKETK